MQLTVHIAPQDGTGDGATDETQDGAGDGAADEMQDGAGDWCRGWCGRRNSKWRCGFMTQRWEVGKSLHIDLRIDVALASPSFFDSV